MKQQLNFARSPLHRGYYYCLEHHPPSHGRRFNWLKTEPETREYKRTLWIPSEKWSGTVKASYENRVSSRRSRRRRIIRTRGAVGGIWKHVGMREVKAQVKERHKYKTSDGQTTEEEEEEESCWVYQESASWLIMISTKTTINITITN